MTKTNNVCLECGKQITKRKNKFCNRSCAASYNNRNRKNTTKGKTKIGICVECGKEIEVSVHINKQKIKCDECKKHNRPHSKQIKSILDCSKRTAVKIVRRAGVGCAICGWNESTCDIHHIVPRKEGGTNDNSNLIIICPNCHRKIHADNAYTRDYLQTLSIDKTFVNWIEYYHISN